MLWKSNFPELLRVILGWQVWGGGGLMDGEDGPQLNQLAPICLATLRQLSKKSKVWQFHMFCSTYIQTHASHQTKYFEEYSLKKYFCFPALEEYSLNKVSFVIQPRVILLIISFLCLAKSDPGLTAPLHLLHLPILNASKFKEYFNNVYEGDSEDTEVHWYWLKEWKLMLILLLLML